MSSQTTSPAQSGQAPFAFSYLRDLHTLPALALDHEVDLHGGFAFDRRPDFGHIYYGMPGLGLLRVEPDLRRQELIKLPADANARSISIVSSSACSTASGGCACPRTTQLWSLLSASMASWISYCQGPSSSSTAPETPFKPTDTALLGNRLYVADGYGSNFISIADPGTHQWLGIFGGKTEDDEQNGQFGTAHGLRPDPTDGNDRLVVADRPHSRLQIHAPDGQFLVSHRLPAGAWPCGIDYIQLAGRWYGVIGNLKDPLEGRPAPIYIVDAETYAIRVHDPAQGRTRRGARSASAQRHLVRAGRPAVPDLPELESRLLLCPWPTVVRQP